MVPFARNPGYTDLEPKEPTLMYSMEVVAMLLCSATAVLVAFTKCPCAGVADESSADPRLN